MYAAYIPHQTLVGSSKEDGLDQQEMWHAKGE